MEGKPILIIVAILFIISIGFEVILSRKKKARYDQLMYLLMTGKYEEFDALLEKKSTHFFVPVYNWLFLKVTKSIMMNDISMLDQVLNDADKIKMNDNQKLYLYSKAFSYYLAKGENESVEKCYDVIKTCKASKAKEYLDMVYNTFIEKGYKYIEKAEQMRDNATEADKENLTQLIQAMYVNKG